MQPVPGAPPLLAAPPIAAPSCRPVGPAMRVTASAGNTVLALDGVPALEAMREVLQRLAEEGRERLSLPIQVGGDGCGSGGVWGGTSARLCVCAGGAVFCCAAARTLNPKPQGYPPPLPLLLL